MRTYSSAMAVAIVLLAGGVAAQCGGGAAAPCDRACLEGFVDRYLEALVAHNPFGLPLAQKVRFSENDQPLPLGDGLWNTATGLGTYRLVISDPQGAQAGFFGTMRENGTPVAVALRLKLDGRKIAEAESLVLRDAPAVKNMEALGHPDRLFVEPLSPAERVGRKELIAAANKYLDGLERGNGDIVPFDAECDRIQNGTLTTNNPALTLGPNASWNPFALGCREQFGTKFFSFLKKVHPRRFPVIDEERGVVLGFLMAQVPGTVKSVDVPGHGTIAVDPANRSPFTLDAAELYKIRSGKIRKLETIQMRMPYGTRSAFEW